MIAIFRKALHDSRRTIIWLSIGMSIYVLLVLSFYPTIAEDTAALQEIVDSYPDAMITMFYGSDSAENLDLFSPGNFIQSQFMVFFILLLGAVIIGQAFNNFTNAERDGSMDMLLSLPISRREMLLGRGLSTVVFLLVVLTALFVTMVVGSAIWEEFEATIPELAAASYGMFFPVMVIAGLIYLLVAVVPSSRKFTGAVVYLFLVGSYLFYGFSGAVPELNDVRPFFIYDYYNAGQIIDGSGYQVGDALTLAVIAASLFGLAWWRIDHKEMGV
ncbi:MAG: ABC transporter permease subunit [Anaerolineae bacterium]|nr:ABC transporter permease subunit [Anaerolineae bacterium]